jgi:hypothetical protein
MRSMLRMRVIQLLLLRGATLSVHPIPLTIHTSIRPFIRSDEEEVDRPPLAVLVDVLDGHLTTESARSRLSDTSIHESVTHS